MKFPPKISKKLNLLWILSGLLVSTLSPVFPVLAQAPEPSIDETTLAEDLNFSEQQASEAARVFVLDHETVLRESTDLAIKLLEQKDLLVPELGTERISKIKEALALPEHNIVLKRAKLKRLDDLNADHFSDIDLNDPASVNLVGEEVYQEYAKRGGEFALSLGIHVPGVGKAKPTNIDGHVFPRVVHEKTGIAFLFLPKEVDLNSKHLKLYDNRIVSIADHGNGRPRVFVQADLSELRIQSNDETIRYQFRDKPKTWREKLKTFWHASYVKPDAGAYVLTGFSVLFQGVMNAGMSYASYALGGAPSWDLSSTKVAAVFGTIFGIFGSTYNNMTKPRDPMSSSSVAASQMKKIVSSSMWFSYIVFMLRHDGDFSQLSLTTAGSWLNHIGLWSNILLSSVISENTTRVYLNMREEMGLSRGEVNLAGVQVKKTQFDDQVVSQLPRAARMVGLLDPRIQVGAMMLPFGNLVYLGYAITAQYVVLKYAEKVNYRGAPELRRRWENYFGPYFRGLKFIAIDGMSNLSPSDPTATFGSIGLQMALHTAKSGARFVSDQISKVRSLAMKSLDSCGALLNGDATTHQEQNTEAPFKPSTDGKWLEATI